jgi:hypothetical protein
MPNKILPYWLTPSIAKAAAVMAGLLFVVSYAVDITLANFNVAPADTVLNDIAIALIATSVMIFYLASTHTENIFSRAKERMNLTAEVNYHLRQALNGFRCVAEIEDREERLRMLDEAIEHVDHLLVDLVPTVNAETPPRFDSSLRP